MTFLSVNQHSLSAFVMHRTVALWYSEPVCNAGYTVQGWVAPGRAVGQTSFSSSFSLLSITCWNRFVQGLLGQCWTMTHKSPYGPVTPWAVHTAVWKVIFSPKFHQIWRYTVGVIHRDIPFGGRNNPCPKPKFLQDLVEWHGNCGGLLPSLNPGFDECE